MKFCIPSRPDLTTSFNSLNDDTLSTSLEFVGGKSYSSFGGINKHCREVYLNTKGMTKETFLFGYGSLAAIKDRCGRLAHYSTDRVLLEAVGKGVVLFNRRDVFELALQERKYDILSGICCVAAWEGRIDLLDEVWSNVNNDTEDIRSFFGYADIDAARNGKLDVLKWFDGKGVSIIKEGCAKVADFNGHLHIIQWLQEVKDLELDGESYIDAIRGGGYYVYNDALCGGGQLHVLKWLRKQKVPWSELNFCYAAEEGIVDILQWLHNEGCPWPDGDDYRACADQVRPEALAWLLSNGYGDRIYTRLLMLFE